MFSLARLLLAFTFALSLPASAWSIVIRHDVSDERYRAEASAFPQLADLPGSGHGVLISPRWVVTAAHAAQGCFSEIKIAGVTRRVERVIVHSGYRPLPEDVIERAMASGDGAEVARFLSQSDDIALIQLADPVTDVSPIAIYRGASEMGKTVQIFGKGATGTGLEGTTFDSPQRTSLRRAFNTIDTVEDRWIAFTFDEGPRSLRLEGTGGSGDSGGPALIRIGGRWTLAGLMSWKRGVGDIRLAQSLYGHGSYNVRLSHYEDWIRATLSESGDKATYRR